MNNNNVILLLTMSVLHDLPQIFSLYFFWKFSITIVNINIIDGIVLMKNGIPDKYIHHY